MNSSDYRYTYGPVLSRRLGRSLGVDLVPFKTCTYDCIYCQLGRTTNKTIIRKEYIPSGKIIAEIRKRLFDSSPVDFITLAGSGEPTLHSNVGEIIRTIKKLTSIPVAVITNGSLLSINKVQDALLEADLIMPSLDAGSENMFININRPCEDIDFNSMVKGLCEFRNRFNNRIWLEVLLVSKLTDSISEVERIADLANRIKPEKVQLNTVSRPPAEKSVQSVSYKRLMALSKVFKVKTETIIQSESYASSNLLKNAINKNNILALLERRPCTARSIADSLGISISEAVKQLDRLSTQELITVRFGNDRLFYKRNRA